MNKLIVVFAALIVLFTASFSKPLQRSVTAPEIAATNCSYLNLKEVELNDTATVLSFHVKYNPGWWIRMNRECILVADGKEYPVVSSENLQLGKKFTIPKSGEADFRLTFAPVPAETKSLDFIEVKGECAFYGIDISGEKKDSMAGILSVPEDIRNVDVSELNMDPVLDAAPTELRIHILGYRPEYGKKLNMVLDNMAHFEITVVELDKNGECTLSIPLYGTTKIILIPDDLKAMNASVYVAPGEATDIYVIPEIFSDYVKSQWDQNAALQDTYAYTNGRYAAFNKAKGMIDKVEQTAADLDWHMNADEFTAAQVAAHKKNTAAIDNSSLPEVLKSYARRKLNMEMMEAMVRAVGKLEDLYISERGEEGFIDSVKIEIKPEHYAVVAGLIDGDDKACFMHPSELRNVFLNVDWPGYGAKGAIFSDMQIYKNAYKNAMAGKLTDSDVKKLETLSQPFYAKAAVLRQNETERAAREANKTISRNPDVPDELLFDAIVEKHKGKVVLIDLWNTWCGPCRQAFKIIEPLKSGELADEDIVWVYIADESSIKDQYVEIIKDIKGEHYMLNASQIGKIHERFGVDGIPFFILVTRDGKAEGRPDFHDPAKLIKGIKSAL